MDDKNRDRLLLIERTFRRIQDDAEECQSASTMVFVLEALQHRAGAAFVEAFELGGFGNNRTPEIGGKYFELLSNGDITFVSDFGNTSNTMRPTGPRGRFTEPELLGLWKMVIDWFTPRLPPMSLDKRYEPHELPLHWKIAFTAQGLASRISHAARPKEDSWTRDIPVQQMTVLETSGYVPAYQWPERKTEVAQESLDAAIQRYPKLLTTLAFLMQRYCNRKDLRETTAEERQDRPEVQFIRGEVVAFGLRWVYDRCIWHGLSGVELWKYVSQTECSRIVPPEIRDPVLTCVTPFDTPENRRELWRELLSRFPILLNELTPNRSPEDGCRVTEIPGKRSREAPPNRDAPGWAFANYMVNVGGSLHNCSIAFTDPNGPSTKGDLYLNNALVKVDQDGREAIDEWHGYVIQEAEEGGYLATAKGELGSIESALEALFNSGITGAGAARKTYHSVLQAIATAERRMWAIIDRQQGKHRRPASTIESKGGVAPKPVANNDLIKEDLSSTGITVTEAARRLLDVLNDSTLENAKSRVVKAANAGKFKTNGKRSRARRLDPHTFNSWKEEIRQKELAKSEEEPPDPLINAMLRGVTPRDTAQRDEER